MTTRRTRLLTPLIALMALIGPLTGCGGERASSTDAEGGRLSIATGNTTGVYYQLGGGYARLVGQYVPGWQATAEATGASVENIRRVVAGDSDIGFTLADTAADAATGRNGFDSAQPIRALARIYTNYTQVLVRTDANIATLADLKGQPVSTGSPNSGTEVIALRLLAAAGLDPDQDVTRQKLSLPETVQAMKDGTVKAMFWSGGLPTAGVTDLITSRRKDVTFLDLSAELPRLQDEFGPVYQAATIEPDVYGTAKPVPTIGVPNLLVVKDSMDAGLAEKLTALLFDHRADLVKVHPEANNITREAAVETSPVVLHPGAQKYFDTH